MIEMCIGMKVPNPPSKFVVLVVDFRLIEKL